MYKRAEYQLITERMKEARKFIQVVMEARQVGKYHDMTTYPLHRHSRETAIPEKSNA